MDTSLYCPELGYYERGAGQVGRGGDFYTSVSAGRLFGALLAEQFADWLGERGTVHLVEAGAHDGQLAHDILSALAARHSELFGRIHYRLIEPSLQRQNLQRLKLENFAPRVEWFSGFETLPGEGVEGVIFSNELLDAFPVHVLAWDALRRCWFEWGVAWEGDRFVWRRMEAAPDQDWFTALANAGFELPQELLAVLPDGFSIELSPAAADWWGEAAGALRRGRLVTVDYGLTALERLDPGRAKGTVRGYSNHKATTDVLDHPGEQDLTAHVNFTQLQLAGERAGLRTEGLFTQSQFLSRIATRHAAKGWATDTVGKPWTSDQVRQFQTLTHPEHLGRAFRVLVQSR